MAREVASGQGAVFTAVGTADRAPKGKLSFPAKIICTTEQRITENICFFIRI
jgi:hypothetical protein